MPGQMGFGDVKFHMTTWFPILIDKIALLCLAKHFSKP